MLSFLCICSTLMKLPNLGLWIPTLWANINSLHSYEAFPLYCKVSKVMENCLIQHPNLPKPVNVLYMARGSLQMQLKRSWHEEIILISRRAQCSHLGPYRKEAEGNSERKTWGHKQRSELKASVGQKRNRSPEPPGGMRLLCPLLDFSFQRYSSGIWPPEHD